MGTNMISSMSRPEQEAGIEYLHQVATEFTGPHMAYSSVALHRERCLVGEYIREFIHIYRQAASCVIDMTLWDEALHHLYIQILRIRGPLDEVEV